jgi:hypothetical protein
MKKPMLLIALFALSVTCVMISGSYAADPKPAVTGETKPLPGQSQEQMPPTGPPAEMKALANLVGTWGYTMKMKMDPASDQFQEIKMTCKMAYILDGAAMTLEHESTEQMMGMTFKGLGIQTYDREKKEWQMTWTDNMTGRTGIYTGQRTDSAAVFTGEDVMMGQKYLSRTSMFNCKPTSFDWKMEMSMDDGKTWMVSATATFTKLK